MDAFFNDRFAGKVTEIISKLDDDEAEMFMRFATYDVLMADIEANRRTLDNYTDECLRRVQKNMDRTLARVVSKGIDIDAKTAAALVGVVTKAKDKKGEEFATPWEKLYHQPQRRGKGGRWSINISREKYKGSKYAQSAAGEQVYAGPSREKGDVIVGGEGGPHFNLTTALASGGKLGGRTSAFEEAWNQQNPAYASTNRRTYDRIAAGATALEGVGGAKMQAATTVARFFGEYGPQAERVVGPHLRRTAYRYRGTERAPDADLVGAQGMRNTKIREILRNDGLSESDIDEPIRTEGSQKASIQYLMGRLPKKSYSKLQAASGKIPPSEGIIINADGRIITQAVGYMDDHYLPFNLKNLKGLQGGSYVRTRSQGGLTTEDIYTGLVSGARSVTVVSRSGIFTANFDDAFRGSRRYNDKAAGMVGRYAKTLDAVQSKQVERQPLSLEEKAQIRDEVERQAEEDDPGLKYTSRADLEDRIKEKIQEYRVRPSLTKEEISDIETRAMKGNEGDERRYKLARSELISAALEAKTQRAYQLDGEGYAAALEAMREQFPYYIDSVRYTTRKDAEFDNSLSSETDVGYVKPGYIRPEGALEGYFDTTIRGKTGHKVGDKETGKVPAAHTNYANWAYNPERGRIRAANEKAAEGGGSTEPAAGTPATGPLAEREKLANAKLKAEGKGSLKKVVDIYAGGLPPEDSKHYPTLIRAGNDFEAVYNDPAQKAELEKDIKRVMQMSSNNTDWTNEHAEATKLMRAYRAAGSGSPWDSSKAGDKPDQPFTFDVEGGKRVAYSPAAKDNDIEPEWRKQAAKAGEPSLSLGSLNDDQLATRAAAFGQAAHSLKAGDLDSVAEQMVEGGANDATVTYAMREAERGDAEKMADKLLAKSEAYHRLRRLQHNHSGVNVGAKPVAATQHHNAAGQPVASEQVGNTRSTPTVGDLTGAGKAFTDLANSIGSSTPEMSAAYRQAGKLVLNLQNGSADEDQTKRGLKILLKSGKLTQSQVDTLRAHLDQYGLDPGD